MKKTILLIFLAIAGIFGAKAQINGDGYYRVTNAASGYYSWMVDCTGGISGTTAQMYALQLWSADSRDPLCEPQTVIYLTNKGGSSYNLSAQGTSVYDIVGAYLNISGNASKNEYIVSAVAHGVTEYLYQKDKDNNDGYRSFTTSGNAADRKWKALPITASSDNYFGIKPTMKVNGKHYAPFYASFPFKFNSTGMKAYYINKVDKDGVAVIKEVTTDIIPANTPLLIECSSADTKDNKLDLLYGNYAAVAGNQLTGNFFCCDYIDTDKSKLARITYDSKTMRVWNVNAEGKLCLSTNTSLLHKSVYPYEKDFYLNANSSYLKVDSNTPQELVIMTEAEYAEFIKNRPVPVTDITVSAAATTIYVGHTTTVTATVTPSDATDATYKWSSSNTAVATVSQDGTVTAVGKGTATITATANDGSGVKGSVTITVDAHKFTVTFLAEDGKTVLSTQTVDEGSKITAPAAPEKEGYTFTGWTPEFSSTVTDNATYTATYTINNYTITYVVDGKTFVQETYAYGAKVTPIADKPTKEGHTFTGWTEIPETMPAKNVTVNATFSVNTYTITYTVDGKEYGTQDYTYGANVTLLAEPTKEGYTFSGWQNAPATMPAKNVTVSGTFSINTYTVTYTVDGEVYGTQEYTYGADVTLLTEPTKEGYTFSGWQNAPATMPASNVTVPGTFSINTYTITYYVDGEVYKTEEYKYGEKVTPLANLPIKTGYTWSGWSEIPSTMPANDVKVTSSYEANLYKITYYIDGIEFKVVEYAYGSEVVAPEAPEKEGYSINWTGLPATMPAYDTFVFGSYTINTYTITYYVDGEYYDSQQYVYGRTVTPLAAPAAREGYFWSGWSEIPATMPAHDVKVYGDFTSTDAILGITVDGNASEKYYTIDGKPLSAPRKGINVVRKSDGSMRKIVVK